MDHIFDNVGIDISSGTKLRVPHELYASFPTASIHRGGFYFDTGANAMYYSDGSLWKSFGGVTSVAASISGALSVSGSPITTAGTLAFTWTGTDLQYVKGDGTLGTYAASGGSVTAVAAGAGMNFTTITSSGNVVLGTPSSITLISTDSVSGTTHSHALALGGTSAQYLRGDNTLATFPTIPVVNWKDERVSYGDSAVSGINYSDYFIFHKTPNAITLGSRSAGTIGGYSLALGLSNKATANYCYAFGSNNSVGGGVSVAVGDSNSISAQYSFAAGASNTIIGAGNAVALGNSNSSSGSVGVSIGYQCTASGLISTAIGDLAIASANWAKAFGRSVTASHEGAMVLGDGDTTVRTSAGANTLTTRFASGYFYYGGAVLIDNLAGTGTRMVVASSTGVLSTQAIPAGTVTSVTATIGGALSVSGSPITTSGTLAFSWTGSTGQYVRGDGSLATFPSIPAGTVTSISAGAGMDFATITTSGAIVMGLPSAITLASINSVSGTTHTHAFTPGGTTGQYIRGDGSLATFPTDLDGQTLTWTKGTSNLAISGGNNVNLFTLTSLATSDLIKWDGTDWVNFAPTWTTNVGTVTSVGMTITGSTALTVAGSPITTSGTFAVTWTGSAGQYVKGDGTLGTYSGGSGTVTSVGLALPSSTFDITGSPVTTTGTLTGGFISQTKKTVLAAPWGSNGTPLWRQLQISDLQQNGATNGQVVTWNSGAGEWTAMTPTATGTVTSVSAGNGMTFTTITASGAVTMGTPSSITLSSTNSVGVGTHSHALALGGTSAQYLRGDNTLATFPTIPSINWAHERVAFGQTSSSGLNYSANFIYHIVAAAITLGSRAAGSIGGYSLALGLNNIASANYSYAFGNTNNVSGDSSVAVGNTNTVSVANSFAAGGSNSVTTVGNAIALGNSNLSSGSVAVSIGYQCTASGLISTAIGDLAIASGSWARAIGRSVTASHQGAMVLGDSDTTVRTSAGANTLTTRFASGYFYYGGAVLIDNLAGTGTRMVVASSTGILSTQAIPSGGGSVWKIQGSSTDATSITDNIWHNGNVALGNFAGGTSGYRLSVAGTSYFTSTMITNNNTAFQAFKFGGSPVEVWKVDGSDNWLIADSNIKVTSTDIVIKQYPSSRSDSFYTVAAARLMYTDGNGKILLTDKKAFYNDVASAGSQTQQGHAADSTWRRLTNVYAFQQQSISSQFSFDGTTYAIQIPKGNQQYYWVITTIEYETQSGSSGTPVIEFQFRLDNATTYVQFPDWKVAGTETRNVVTFQTLIPNTPGSGWWNFDVYCKVITGSASIYVNKHVTTIRNGGYTPV